MAQGTINTEATRNHLFAVFARNIGDLEGEMSDLQTAQATVEEAVTEAQATVEEAVTEAQATVEEAVTEAQATVENLFTKLVAAGCKVLNGPNLLKQPTFTTVKVPSSAVITEELTVPIEDATAAQEPLTYTITNEAITSSYKLHGVKSSNYDVVGYGKVSATFAAGSATITIAARPAAHNAAVTVTVYLCTEADGQLPYGEIARSYATSQPWLDSINNGAYLGDAGEQISESVVTLTGADIVTEEDGTEYTKAVAFTVTNPPSSGWGNADKLIWYYGSMHSIEMENGEPKYRRYGQIDEMVVGKTYTMSCWARITSGTKAMLWLGACPYNSQWIRVPNGYEYHEINANSGAWQRVTFSFVFQPSTDQFYTFTSGDKTYQAAYWLKQVGFGVCRKYAGTVQLCGFRLVEGELYNADAGMLVTQYNTLTAALTALTARVTALEGTINTASTGLSARVAALEATVLEMQNEPGE